jgi:hypothetical protein
MGEALRQLTTVTDVREYFRDTVGAVRSSQGLDVRPDTEAYLVELLVGFSSTETLFAKDGGRVTGEPLALMLARAVEAPAPERARQLRRMGDTALYVSGFFSDSLQRQLVDVDYYASMGGRAYDALGDLNRGAKTAQVFRELGAKFVRVVDLFNEISERALCTSNAGLLRLYERYVRTGSDRLRRLLEDKGVLATAGSLSWQ